MLSEVAHTRSCGFINYIKNLNYCSCKIKLRYEHFYLALEIILLFTLIKLAVLRGMSF